MQSLGLTAQLEAEWRRAGLSFRVMLVGESGLGKSTFTRALFRPFVPDNELSANDAGAKEALRARTTEIREVVFTVENDGFPIEFSVVDCPGYGDSVDSTEWIDSIVGDITRRFASHYDSNHASGASVGNGLQRDGMVHACLYFIAAHRLKGADIEFMKRLQPYVNIVPVIAKSDTMTVGERDAFRRLILSELKAARVSMFELAPPPAVASPPSSARGAASKKGAPTPPPSPPSRAPLGEFGERILSSVIPPPSAPPPKPPAASSTPAQRGAALAHGNTSPPPFAVCASEDGTRVYPWGVACAEDPTHSDLSTLRAMLFAGSMLSAKRATLGLYEQAYARRRAADERSQQEREARALSRQVFAAKTIAAVITLGVAVGLAASAAPAAAATVVAHAQSAASAAGTAALRAASTGATALAQAARKRIAAKS